MRPPRDQPSAAAAALASAPKAQSPRQTLLKDRVTRGSSVLRSPSNTTPSAIVALRRGKPGVTILCRCHCLLASKVRTP